METAPTTLQCVVLHHVGYDKPHFDFMLELHPGALLTTWRLPVWPLVHRVRIEKLANHRRDYLSYEGPVSGGRGEVTRVFRGRCMLTMDPEFNTAERWNWELRFQPESENSEILLRRWIDSAGQEIWDAAPM